MNHRPTLRWALAASFAALIAVTATLVMKPSQGPDEQTYIALGSPSRTQGGDIVVLFRPDATEMQLRQLLNTSGARIVDGPTTAGAYVLKVDEPERDRALQTMRQSGLAVLAQPLDREDRR